jgi:hypothetical protein
MNDRQRALERIRIEVATEGKVTHFAIRTYVENRISYAAFMEAARRGLAQFRHSVDSVHSVEK